VEFNVRSHVAQSCYSVIGDKSLLWSKANSTRRDFVLPRPIITKLNGMTDYVVNPY